MAALECAPLIPNENLRKPDKEKMTFQDCVIKIKKTYEETSRAFDAMAKFDIIRSTMKTYFDSEDAKDVFEGFLHLIRFVKTLVAEDFDLSLVKLALLTFYEFQKHKMEKDQSAPFLFSAQDTLLLDALELCFRLKAKHIDVVGSVFHLKNKEMLDIAVNRINDLFSKDIAKAVAWIVYLNLRDHFPFKTVVCTLILENQTALLYPFIGEDQYRRTKFIHYLDELIGDVLRNRMLGDDLEQKIVSNHKHLEKLTRKFVKNFQIADSEVPNLMKLGTQNALLYNHYRWRKREISWSQFEEIARHAMMPCPDVRDRYFRRLFDEGLPREACHFAEVLGVSEERYIPQLKQFYAFFPWSNLTQYSIAISKQNQELEEQNTCELYPGYPIIVTDTWDKLEELIAHLRDDGEELFGIDAEWRPHFLSATEKISLIQIATTKAVFLVDALLLETEGRMTESQWLNFFDALLCTEGPRKTGGFWMSPLRPR